jgi:hypothetical protein
MANKLTEDERAQILAYYTPPVGGYAQADGTINDAPWRQETER